MVKPLPSDGGKSLTICMHSFRYKHTDRNGKYNIVLCMLAYVDARQNGSFWR